MWPTWNRTGETVTVRNRLFRSLARTWRRSTAGALPNGGLRGSLHVAAQSIVSCLPGCDLSKLLEGLA